MVHSILKLKAIHWVEMMVDEVPRESTMTQTQKKAEQIRKERRCSENSVYLILKAIQMVDEMPRESTMAQKKAEQIRKEHRCSENSTHLILKAIHFEVTSSED